MSIFESNLGRPIADVLQEHGYVWDIDRDMFVHPKKTKETHPNTFRIVSDVLLDARRHRFVLEAVEFEESLRPTKDSKFYGELRWLRQALLESVARAFQQVLEKKAVS